MQAETALSGAWTSRLLIAGITAVAGGLLAIGLWGWAQYGADVFFEMIVSGIASCF